jgi:pimeloyl-ACP methyl ester carboxylesterase
MNSFVSPALNNPIFLPTPDRHPELPLLVLMPGMDGTGHLWRSQLPQLTSHFDVRCLSIPPHNLATWEELSDQVIHLIKQEPLKDREVYLCGESFGACLAMQLATQLPNLYHRLILINPASSFSRLPWLGWAGQACGWLPEPIYYLTTWVGLPLLASLERINPEDRTAILRAVQSVPQNTVAWRLGMLRDFQISPQQLQQLQQPVLILAGGSDRILPSLQESDRLRQHLPQAKVIALPKSGHACMLETEISLDTILQTWL